jgi:hypothetical protein
MPAAAARRRIIRQALRWLMAWSASLLPLCPRAVRNSQPLHSAGLARWLVALNPIARGKSSAGQMGRRRAWATTPARGMFKAFRDPSPKFRFAPDSLLEEAGFELLVPCDTTKFPRGLTSPLLDLPVTGKSARTRTETTTPPRSFSGTNGSKPVPSSGESATNRAAARDLRAAMRRPRRADVPAGRPPRLRRRHSGKEDSCETLRPLGRPLARSGACTRDRV